MAHLPINAIVLNNEIVTDFAQSLSSGTMLVKSIATGELKTIDVQGNVKILNDGSISNLVVRDGKIVPKQNYSKADPDMVNIHAHRGPDEL